MKVYEIIKILQHDLKWMDYSNTKYHTLYGNNMNEVYYVKTIYLYIDVMMYEIVSKILELLILGLIISGLNLKEKRVRFIKRLNCLVQYHWKI